MYLNFTFYLIMIHIRYILYIIMIYFVKTYWDFIITFKNVSNIRCITRNCACVQYIDKYFFDFGQKIHKFINIRRYKMKINKNVSKNLLF